MNLIIIFDADTIKELLECHFIQRRVTTRLHLRYHLIKTNYIRLINENSKVNTSAYIRWPVANQRGCACAGHDHKDIAIIIV